MFFCVHKSAYGLLLRIQLDLFMYTRVQNGMLCTREHKSCFIVEVLEVLSFYFGYSHYTLTSVICS